MALNDAIVFDGRVQRAAEAVSRIADVTVLCLRDARKLEGTPYHIMELDVPRAFQRWPLLHLYFAAKLRKLALHLRPQVVYAHDFLTVLGGRRAARAAGARFVYDAHELILPGAYGRDGVGLRLWYWQERLAIRSADLVIAANRDRAAEMQRHYGLATTPTVVRNIPPAPATVPGTARPESMLPPRGRAVRCIYQGDVNLDRGLQVFIDAMRTLDDGFELVVVGGGVDLEKVRRQALEGSLSGRVHVLGRITRDRLQSVMAECDIGLVTYSPHGLNNLYCAPNKIFEYAQAGLPVVSTAQPGIREYLDHHPIGTSFDNSRPHDECVADAAGAIRSTAGNLEAMRQALPAFLARHSWDREQDILIDSLARLLEGPAESTDPHAVRDATRHD